MDKSIEEEVSTFVGEEEPVIEASPVEEPPVEPVPPKEEPSVVESPPIDVPPSVEPSVETPPVEPVPPVVEPPVVKDPKDEEIENLRGTVEELRRMIEDVATKATSPIQQEPPIQVDAEGKPIPPAPVTPPLHSFVKEDKDIDTALNSVDNFNSLLSSVVHKGIEGALSIVPKFVEPLVERIVARRLAVNEFYTNNQDLSKNKAYVGMVANELAAKNPEWSLEDVIKNLAKEVRDKLRLTGQVVQHPPDVTPQVDTPAFTDGTPTRSNSGAPVLSKVEADIMEMIQDL